MGISLSILLNTARFQILSYMTQEESSRGVAEVGLVRDGGRHPGCGAGRHDQAVLDDAYRLTRGSPIIADAWSQAVEPLQQTDTPG